MEQIIGRVEEQKVLQKIFDSRQAEFLAIFGRRRVGKTYLIKRFFTKKSSYYFSITGVKEGLLREQLYEFTRAVEKVFYQAGTTLKEPDSWMAAFEMLTSAIEQYSGKKKVVLFFDEIPWLATKRSRFLQALDYYWNTKWVENARIKLIVCGSAASWVIKNIVNNKGGLHNRITGQIRLDPFTLCETKAFLKYRNVHFNTQQVLTLYMGIGGIPHYLNQVEKNLSAVQNIDKLCFTKNGMLFKEFDNLFSSLFEEAELYIKILRHIAKHRYGIERRALLKALKISSGGRFDGRLRELEETGFIVTFKPYGRLARGHYYRVIDEYSLFYLYWIEPVMESIRYKNKPLGYWEKQSVSPAWKSWSGYAFEAVCYKHLVQISNALQLGPAATPYTWRYVAMPGSVKEGAQIDLLFDREDGAITVCEIKYTEQLFAIDKEYAAKLHKKIDIFQKVTGVEKQIFLVMISARGIKKTMYSEEMLHGIVVLENLFV
jgi:AAA+ ATPase superfamily predicted ATPase